MRVSVAVISGFLGAVCTIWFISAASGPTWRINAHNAEQIEKGMTLEEVNAIFGAPPGDYSTPPTWVSWGQMPGVHCWRTDEIVVNVVFDQVTGRVVDVHVSHLQFSWSVMLLRGLQL